MSDIHTLKAKSPEQGGEGLREHTLQVVRRMGELKHRLPRLSDELGIPNLWSVLFWSAWLHDFGKAASGFQQMLSGGPAWLFRHEVLSLAFLEWVFGRGTQEYALAASAIASHHRDFQIIEQQYIDQQPEDTGIDERWQAEMDLWRVEALLNWTKLEANQAASQYGFDLDALLLREIDPIETQMHGSHHIHHALNAFNDYYQQQAASRRPSRRVQSFRHQAICLRGLILQADRLASASAPSLRLPNLQEVASALPVSQQEWYEHQHEAKSTVGNALLAAPTGSGKTEAAMLWAQTQLDQKRTGAVFYLLPFQASINAMYKRIYERYGVAKGDVALMHSRAVQTVYRELSQETDSTVKEATRRAQRQKSLARLHQQPVCVATPYQLLRAAFKLPGYEGQWVMLRGGHLIVDEIHGYEPTRLGLLLELFSTLMRDWDVRLFCMTATMPTWLREMLVEVTGIEYRISAAPKLFERFQRHRIHIVRGKLTDQEALETISGRVVSGEKVLVVANLVDTAQLLARELKGMVGDEHVTLLHSRFTSEDRLEREHNLIERLEQKQGFVAVATQVVEVSLDVNFNTIYTEPAPLEALLQRFGRVNRESRPQQIRPVHVMEEAVDWVYPYRQEPLLRRTISLLQDHHEQVVDESKVSDWLDQIYGPDVETLSQEVEKGRQAFREACGPDQLVAFQSDPEIKRWFYKLFDGYEILPRVLFEPFIDRESEGRFIEAFSLLVPISRGRFHALKSDDKITYLEEYKVFMADCHYNSSSGISFDEPSKSIALID